LQLELQAKRAEREALTRHVRRLEDELHHVKGLVAISYWFITRLKFSRPNEVDSNEVAISTETYEITGREVSSLLGDQAQDDGSRWISIAVITY
jgi:hypothetical protein